MLPSTPTDPLYNPTSSTRYHLKLTPAFPLTAMSRTGLPTIQHNIIVHAKTSPTTTVGSPTLTTLKTSADFPDQTATQSTPTTHCLAQYIQAITICSRTKTTIPMMRTAVSAIARKNISNVAILSMINAPLQQWQKVVTTQSTHTVLKIFQICIYKYAAAVSCSSALTSRRSSCTAEPYMLDIWVILMPWLVVVDSWWCCLVDGWRGGIVGWCGAYPPNGTSWLPQS